MFLIRKARALSVRRDVEAAARAYGTPLPADRIRAWQLDRLRSEWRRITAEVPYFAKLRNERRLPAEIRDWTQFREEVPEMGRRQLGSGLREFQSRSRKADTTRCTGGSTAEPVTLPIWNSEIRRARANLWLGRRWFGVRPSDRLFLLWGHGHLFGHGLTGTARRLGRSASDKLLGYCRHSAYDLSDEAMRHAGSALVRFRPHYVVGYAVALDRFARANQNRREVLHRLKLKVTFATAESFPRRDSAACIQDVLGCPVAMEYGAVETGPIAFQSPESDYSVLWRDYLLEGKPSRDVPGAFELLVTSLYPRCVPLVRYRIGDLVSPDPWGDPRRIARVVGRCNDAIRLSSGTVVHSEAFSHAVRDIDGISGFQVTQLSPTEIHLDYVASEPVGAATVAEIRRRLGRIDPGLKAIEVRRVSALAQTIAGKTRRVRAHKTPARWEGDGEG